MASRYETGQIIQRKENGAISIPVHDMPDFTAALGDYGELLRKNGVPPEDVNRAVDGIIENVAARKQGNRFINLVLSLTRKHFNDGNKTVENPNSSER